MQIFTNLTFDNGPNVSLNNESEHEPRNESRRSIFGWLFFRSVRELTFINDFDDAAILLVRVVLVVTNDCVRLWKMISILLVKFL